MGTPTLNSIPFKSPGDLREYVVFDLETTGLHPKTCASEPAQKPSSLADGLALDKNNF